MRRPATVVASVPSALSDSATSVSDRGRRLDCPVLRLPGRNVRVNATPLQLPDTRIAVVAAVRTQPVGFLRPMFARIRFTIGTSCCFVVALLRHRCR